MPGLKPRPPNEEAACQRRNALYLGFRLRETPVKF
jgi:hypothetical protein